MEVTVATLCQALLCPRSRVASCSLPARTPSRLPWPSQANLDGERWPLVNPQRGIFKPRGMPFLLSIRTVFPRNGGRVWYDDQRHVHRQIFAGDEELDYAFMGTDPSAAENVWLWQAAERQIPFIYLLGVSPGRYQAIVPTFVVDWDPRRLSVPIAFGEFAGATAMAWRNTGGRRTGGRRLAAAYRQNLSTSGPPELAQMRRRS